METIAIKDINIGKRIREDYGDVEGLAASISQHGMLQPIVIDNENNLIAGGRRMAAHVHLGLADIWFVRRDSLDEMSRKELELEENLRRKDLEWQEEVRALATLYKSKQDRVGTRITSRHMGTDGYGVEDAAQELDRSKGSISMDLALARGLEEFPELVKEKTKSAAFKRYRRMKETQLRTEEARRTTIIDAPPPSDEETPDDEPAGTVRQPIRRVGWRGRGILYHADARDVLRMHAKKSVDCLVTDPPYALGMFRAGQTTSGARLAENQGTMYDDDPQATMDMLDEVFMHASQVLKDDGHGYVFFHMTRYEPMFLMLRKHFGHDCVEDTPIVWIKNTPGIGDPNRAWVYAYEPCFFINRGRALVKPQAFNYLKYDTVSKKIHATEKPVQLLRHLVMASCVEGEVVLDPFAGSGSTLVGAAQVGCKFIGIEKHEPFFRSAVERVAEDLHDIAPDPVDV